MGVRLPAKDKRLAIVGSTGSGKTVAGAWHLSQADLSERPWFMWNYKRDPLLEALNAIELKVTQRTLPQEPGLYTFSPIPEQDDIKVKELLWKMWEQENCGIYTDEGYMMGNRNSAFNALLTQGRSKNIQMITLSQRPVWMSRFVFSETDFFQVFRLNDMRDYDSIQQMISIDITTRLPSYWSRWYDVGADEGSTFKPVPSPSELIEIINRRLRHKVRML